MGGIQTSLGAHGNGMRDFMCVTLWVEPYGRDPMGGTGIAGHPTQSRARPYGRELIGGTQKSLSVQAAHKVIKGRTLWAEPRHRWAHKAMECGTLWVEPYGWNPMGGALWVGPFGWDPIDPITGTIVIVLHIVSSSSYIVHYQVNCTQ